MYTIMNQDQNQSHAQQTTVAYGGGGAGVGGDGGAPPPLQPLHNYATYELVGAPDSGPVIFQNETANIIVSAMQVPGQEELVFFHDQSSVGDLASYSIEIQEPTPVVEYYPEQQTQHHVLTYETLPQQAPQQHMMDQGMVLCQPQQSLPPQQQQTEQHVVETQQIPSGQILKQQLQQNSAPPPQPRTQQVVMQQGQAQNRPRLNQQQLQQQQVYVQQQQQHHQQQQQQFAVQQQNQQQQLVQQQQFVQQNHQPKQQLVQQTSQQQGHYVQQQPGQMKQVSVQNHQQFLQQKQSQQHFIQVSTKQPMLGQPGQTQQASHYVQNKPVQQQGGNNVQQHFVQSPQQQQLSEHQHHSVIISQMETEQQQRANWEQHQQNQMHLNQHQPSPGVPQQYSAPPTPEIQQQQQQSPQQQMQQSSPQQQQQMQLPPQQQMQQQQMNHQQPVQQQQYSFVVTTQPPGSPRLRGAAPVRGAPRNQSPRPGGARAPGAPPGTPRPPPGTPRPQRTPNPRPPRPTRITGPVATLTRLPPQQGVPSLRQYSNGPVNPRFPQQQQQQQRFMSNSIQQPEQQQIQQQQQQQQLMNKQGVASVVQQVNGQKCYILKNGNQLVQLPGAAPGTGVSAAPGGGATEYSEDANTMLQLDTSKIKTVYLPSGAAASGVKGIPLGKTGGELTGDLKNVKILIAQAGSNGSPARLNQQGPRLLNMNTRPPGTPPEYRMLTGPAPRNAYAPIRQAAPARTMTPPRGARPPQGMSPRPPLVNVTMTGQPNAQLLGGRPQGDSGSPAPPATGEPGVAPPPPVKEEKDLYKAGFLALCSNCGSLSARVNRCNRCNHKIAAEARLVPETGNAGAAGGGVGAPKGGKDSPAPSPGVNSPKPHGTPSPAGDIPSTPPAPAPRTRGRKAQEEPPEILLISSDEEDGEEEGEKSPAKSFPPPLSDKEPSMTDYYQETPMARVCGGGIPDDNVLDTLSEDGRYTHLLCRTVRIGSLKVVPVERVFISRHGIKITLPPLKEMTKKDEPIQLKIYRHEIVKVLAHFGKAMPVIFYYIRAHVGPRIRDLLNMSSGSRCYFDPSSRDETHRRITLLPEKIPEEVKSILSDIYSKEPASSDSGAASEDSSPLPEVPCLAELSVKEANNILVKSSSPEIRHAAAAGTVAGGTPALPPPPPVQTIFIYRPTGISINTEDYACLDREQFINDVIIDFYLGFLLQEMATPQIKAKTHIFSTFFYKRLTQKPTRKVSGSIEGDPNVSAAKKRHSRVQSWTKNINVFEKDFVVVPINSNAHWFLAIICFPGLRGCVNPEGRAVEECQRFKSLRKRERMKLDELQKTGKSGTVTIGNTTISPVTKGGPLSTAALPSRVDPTEAGGANIAIKDEDEENRDEAESEGEDFVHYGEESQDTGTPGERAAKEGERAQSPLRDFEGPVRHPCILIFDSLPQAGNSRVRVVATLRDWLAVEYQVKHGGATRDFSKNVFIGAKPKVPMQTNYHDCGLYLLHYAERFFLEPLADYRLPIMLDNWFTAHDTHRKRYDLQHLLFVLMERQGIDRTSLNLPHLNLDDPDYRSPEHEPEPPDMIEAASRREEEEGREEAEGEEEMGEEEEEEEEEMEEGEVRGVTLQRVERGSNNCDTTKISTELDSSMMNTRNEEELENEEEEEEDEDEEENELVREECVEEEEYEEAAQAPPTPTPTPTPTTKRITITAAGAVRLKQISVAAASPVRLLHTPRPRSKQLLVSAVPTPSPPTNSRRAPAPSEGPETTTPEAALLRNNRNNVSIKRKLGGPSPAPRRPPHSAPGAPGGSNLRNMRIVKKAKTEEEEEEDGGG